MARLASHGATVLIGTPGRLADVVTRTRGNTAALDLRRLEVTLLHDVLHMCARKAELFTEKRSRSGYRATLHIKPVALLRSVVENA